MSKKRSKKELEEREKGDAIFSLWDKDRNLLVDNGKITEKGKKCSEENENHKNKN